MLTTRLVLLWMAIERCALSKGEPFAERLKLNYGAKDSLSIRESEIPPTRPAGRTCTEVGSFVDLLQLSNLFLSQINNFEVP
jgi:hypothetical protein